MIWLKRKWCIFETGVDTNTKQLESSMEAHKVFVGNFVIYQPRVAPRSQSKGNGVSS
jgi:hypothetical protein